MANFPTHIAVGTVVSGAMATVTVAANMVAPENVVAVTLAGVLGSVLPDIDLEESRPAKAMFSGLAIFFSFAVLFGLDRNKYSIAEMLILWLGTLFFVRYGAKEAFFRFSYHRGVWHSLLALVFCSLVTACVFYNLLGRHESVAWLSAVFMGAGYLTHLVLDEIYSVDVMDIRIKSSFGTALKLFDYRHLGHSAAMAIAVVLIFLAIPPSKAFIDAVASRSLWVDLNQRLLPREHWFEGMAWLIKPVASHANTGSDAGQVAADPIATGAIPDPPRAVINAGSDR
ncbi:MAG TPA: metal-dependent hydrolase [Hyphomicrobiaceae bacterium]|nr:metal-dependent hydrolase [Hyphomicrobiaceae bacterium]